MSDGQGIKITSTRVPKQTITKKENKMNTIEHKEKIYQSGAVYEFSDNGEDWFADILEDICSESDYPYAGGADAYSFIRACETSLGTITEPAVKLIDGECYQYKNSLGKERKGFFEAEHNEFCGYDGIDNTRGCTNIKLLTVAGEQQ